LVEKRIRPLSPGKKRKKQAPIVKRKEEKKRSTAAVFRPERRGRWGRRNGFTKKGRQGSLAHLLIKKKKKNGGGGKRRRKGKKEGKKNTTGVPIAQRNYKQHLPREESTATRVDDSPPHQGERRERSVRGKKKKRDDPPPTTRKASFQERQKGRGKNHAVKEGEGETAGDIGRRDPIARSGAAASTKKRSLAQIRVEQRNEKGGEGRASEKGGGSDPIERGRGCNCHIGEGEKQGEGFFG